MAEKKKPKRSMTAVTRYRVVRDAIAESGVTGPDIDKLDSWLKDAALEEAINR